MIRVATMTVASIALSATAAHAQTAAGRTAMPAAQAAPAASATPTVGASVYDSAGVEIGKIESVTADAAVVNTGTAKVALPLTSIGQGTKGLSIAMTKAALDAAASQQQAQAGAALQSRLTAGTQVKGRNATTVIGTIKSADAQNVTVTAANGRDVVLPVSGFSAAPDGSIIVGLTAEQFNAAVGGGAATSTTTSTTTTAPAGAAAPAVGAAGGATGSAAVGTSADATAPAMPGATTTTESTSTTQATPAASDGSATTTTTTKTKKKTKTR